MDDFIAYSDYFAHAVYMHQTASKSLDNLSKEILLIDEAVGLASVSDLNMDDLEKSLVNKIEAVKSSILLNFSKIHYVEASFVELAKYIKNKYRVAKIDDFLTENGIQVFHAYAQTSGVLADSISESNIKEN